MSYEEVWFTHPTRRCGLQILRGGVVYTSYEEVWFTYPTRRCGLHMYMIAHVYSVDYNSGTFAEPHTLMAER